MYTILPQVAVSTEYRFIPRKKIFSDKFAYISSILVNEFRAREKYQPRREECWSYFLIPGEVQNGQECSFFQTGLPTYFACG